MPVWAVVAHPYARLAAGSWQWAAEWLPRLVLLPISLTIVAHVAIKQTLPSSLSRAPDWGRHQPNTRTRLATYLSSSHLLARASLASTTRRPQPGRDAISVHLAQQPTSPLHLQPSIQELLVLLHQPVRSICIINRVVWINIQPFLSLAPEPLVSPTPGHTYSGTTSYSGPRPALALTSAATSLLHLYGALCTPRFFCILQQSSLGCFCFCALASCLLCSLAQTLPRATGLDWIAELAGIISNCITLTRESPRSHVACRTSANSIAWHLCHRTRKPPLALTGCNFLLHMFTSPTTTPSAW